MKWFDRENELIVENCMDVGKYIIVFCHGFSEHALHN